MYDSKYKTLLTKTCSICDKSSPYTCWHMEEPVYIVTNGQHLGIAYNQKSRCYPPEPPQYVMIFDCEWDYINVIDTEIGAIAIAFSFDNLELYLLQGSKEVIEENEEIYNNLFHINAKQISRH